MTSPGEKCLGDESIRVSFTLAFFSQECSLKVMDAVINSLASAAGLFWKAFWALAIGYAFSSLIQVFVSQRSAAQHLGKSGVKELSLAAIFGFLSSSCSFAALSATRSLFAKGAPDFRARPEQKIRMAL